MAVEDYSVAMGAIIFKDDIIKLKALFDKNNYNCSAIVEKAFQIYGDDCNCSCIENENEEYVFGGSGLKNKLENFCKSISGFLSGNNIQHKIEVYEYPHDKIQYLHHKFPEKNN